jgi:hypothetical protein
MGEFFGSEVGTSIGLVLVSLHGEGEEDFLASGCGFESGCWA